MDIFVKKQASDYLKMDIASNLLEDRKIFVTGSVSTEMSDSVNSQLLYLEKIDSSAPITLMIDSPGGSCSAGNSIVDFINTIKNPVHCEVMATAASMGSIIMAACEKGHRLVHKNARVLLHMPLIGGHGISGQETDLEIHADNIVKTRDQLFSFLAERTGQSYEKIMKDCARDFWLNSQEAINYGIADGFVKSRKETVEVKKTSKKK